MTPKAGHMTAFVVALALVIGCYWARLYLPKWPIHPVLFVVWGSYPGWVFAFSFLAGCGIKAFVVKYGGENAFQKLKPFMFGLIGGDMLGGVIPVIIGLIYYLVTGDIPKRFLIMPN
jgi:hypothetical protein